MEQFIESDRPCDRWKEHMSPDTLELIICFLEAKHRMVIELVCMDFRLACLEVERREFLELFSQVNDNEELVCKPLREQPVDEEEIIEFERRIPGFKLDFYMRELLGVTNGRMDWHDSLFHPVNIIAPIGEWTRDFGYLYYKDKQPILNTLQIPDFNFVNDCLICIGSASKKLCWETSSDLEYNPFHIRTTRLYADKKFNLYQLDYSGFEDFTLKKLGNLKKWFQSLLPQRKLTVKIVPKREPIRFATRDKQADPEFVLKYLKNNGSQLKYVSKELRNNKEVVLSAVSNYLDAVQFASDELKDDVFFMRDILLMHPLTIRFCSERVKQTDIALEAIKSNNIKTEELASLSPLEFVPECHYDNKEFVLSILKRTWRIVLSISENLKQDRDVCLEAVKNGCSLADIYPPFIDDKEIVLAGISLSPHQYAHASERLRKDREIVLAAFKKNVVRRTPAPPEVIDNRELMLEVISINGWSEYEILSDRLKLDKEIALKCMSNKWSVYKLLPESLKCNVDILTHALKTKIESSSYYYSEIFNDIPKQFLSKFLTEYSRALLILQAYPMCFQYISVHLRSNKKFIMEALGISLNGFNTKLDIKHIDQSLLYDEDILMSIANKQLGEELLKILPNDMELSDHMKEYLVMTNPVTIKLLPQTPNLIKKAIENMGKSNFPIISLIREDLLTLDLVIFALKDRLMRWGCFPSEFKTKENTIEVLKVYPLLFSHLPFPDKKVVDYINVAIVDGRNFKEIPPTLLTLELVIEALVRNDAKIVTNNIYPHLPVYFYDIEEVNNLLKEKVPNFK